MNDVRVIDRVSRTAALGIAFWDAADATSLIDGLVVEVFVRANPRARVRAQMNRSGIYVAHGVPGLRDLEMSDDPQEMWLTLTKPYRVEVRDSLGRFQPFAFDADLPARGLFTWLAPWISPPQPIVLPTEAGSPPQLLVERIPLFSTAARPVPDPLAAIYAQLRVLGTTTPAAWTLLSVAIDGETCGLGLSDKSGRVSVLFPYPEPPRRTLASPPEQRNDFNWHVELTAYVPAAASPPEKIPDMADLGAVLEALSDPRAVIESMVSPALPLQLAYREALTVRTAGAAADDASFLFVAA